MPQYKHHQFLKASVIVSFMTLLTYLGLNLWERYTLQAEIGRMKTSLHFLKEILVNIGMAYDKLHMDLKELSDVAHQKQYLLSDMQTNIAKPKCVNKYTLDRRKLHDMQVGAMVDAKHVALNFPPKADKITEKHLENIDYRNTGVHAKRDRIIKTVATMTRYPPKSTGVGVDKEHRTSHVRSGNAAICNQYKHDHFCSHDPFDYRNYGDGF